MSEEDARPPGGWAQAADLASFIYAHFPQMGVFETEKKVPE
jgi:hypothetical protein